MDKHIGKNYNYKSVTRDTIGYTWYVGFKNGGGAGAWNMDLKDSVEEMMENIENCDLNVREIKVVERKYKDRMNAL